MGWEAPQSYLSHGISYYLGFSPGALVLFLTAHCFGDVEISQPRFLILWLRCTPCSTDELWMTACFVKWTVYGPGPWLCGGNTCLKTGQFSPTEPFNVCAVTACSFVGLQNTKQFLFWYWAFHLYSEPSLKGFLFSPCLNATGERAIKYGHAHSLQTRNWKSGVDLTEYQKLCAKSSVNLCTCTLKCVCVNISL